MEALQQNLATPEQQKSLTKPERKRYAHLRKQVRKWWNDRLAIGMALAEIKRRTFYREEYASFEDFCQGEYGIERSYAHRLIEAVKVKQSVAASPAASQVTNEAQARALGAVPEEERAGVLEATAETGPVTAQRITETAAQVAAAKEEEPKQEPKPETKAEPPPKRQGPVDKTGYEIPDIILADWKHAEAQRQILHRISELKTEVEQALLSDDFVWAEVSNTVLADLSNSYSGISLVLPHAVCPTCQGLTREQCTLCAHRGFISKFAWDMYVPREIRELRLRLTGKKP
jgi:hypothetical protein